MSATVTIAEGQITGVQHNIVLDVLAERRRQVQLQSAGRFKHVVEDPAIDDMRRLAILAEEFGEAAVEVNEGAEKGVRLDHLRDELIQVIAVSLAWVERIDMDRIGRAVASNIAAGMALPAETADPIGWDPYGNRI